MNKNKSKRITKATIAGLALAGSTSALFAGQAPLTIYDHSNQNGSSAGCHENTVYVGSAIPNNLNNRINSVRLRRGFGLVIGNNNDCVGPSKFYAAASGDRIINLNDTFKNKVSFFRVAPLDQTTNKKGFAGADPALGEAFGASWWYGWNTHRGDFNGLEYVPLKFRGGNETTIAARVGAQKFTNFLAFNEPDNPRQANMTPARAVNSYKLLLRSGLRMGSPVVEQDRFRTWLNDFMEGADRENLRVDFLALHWYDWGNHTRTSTGRQIRNRMAAKVNNARNIVQSTGMSVWLTEFNANVNRRDQADHVNFINNVIPYINGVSWFERYSYFRAGGGNMGNTTRLTASGQAYKDAPDRKCIWRENNNKGW